jgi:iron complex outermembrane recepter protein
MTLIRTVPLFQKHNLVLLVLFVISPFLSAIAQSQGTITLRALDKKNSAVPFASFAITNRADSLQVIQKVADSNGRVSVALKENEQYLITISATGFAPFEKGITIKSGVAVFTFAMTPLSAELKAVVVTSKRPLMRQEDDKTIIDPENMVNSSTNAYEVIEKTPGIFMDQDGNIYLNSTTPATVFINGREMRMSTADIATMLKSLPPGSISRIEVMRTPSAKYDASGAGGVVNVILKKGVKIGLTGSLNANMNQGVYGNQGVGFSLNNNDGKLSSYINTQISRRNSYDQIVTDRRFAADSLLSQDAYTRYPARSFYTGYGISLNAGKKWELSYDGRISLNKSENETVNGSLIRKTSTNTLITDNLGLVQNDANTFSLFQSLEAKMKIDSIGSEWTTGITYSHNRNRTDQDFITNFKTPVVTNTSGDGLISNDRNFFTAQTDLSYKWKKKLTLETGLKTSVMSYKSFTEFFRQFGTVRNKDLSRTNTFNYKENINAAYVQASKVIAGFTIKAGLRMENTNMEGRQIIPGDTTFSINRTDFFPYVYLSRPLLKIMTYPLRGYLVYRRTISRPGYELLNPFPRFVDQYLSETGNPSLRPQFTDNYEANISFDETPILAVGLNQTKDIFTNVVYQADSTQSVAIRTYDNLGTNREMYFRAMGAVPPGGRYFFVAGAQYNHNFYQGLYENKPLSFKRGSWFFFTHHSYKIDKRSTVSCFGFLRLRGQQQFYELGTFGTFNFNINRQFFNKKLIVTLSMTDLFFTNNNEFAIKQGTVDAMGFRQSDTRRVGLNLRYNFGIRKREEGDNSFNAEAAEKGN